MRGRRRRTNRFNQAVLGTNMLQKKKYPRADALKVAKELCDLLKPECARLIVAGSLRRRKDLVGDVEIVYVPKFVPGVRCDMFAAPAPANCVDAKLAWMLDSSSGPILEKRLSRVDTEAWGEKNKLAVHRASGIPVDLFSTTTDAWWNYVVCRTGSAESNTAIASAAQRKNWKWHPYKSGFTDANGDLVRVTSEREVFEFAGLEYKEPWER